MRIIKLISFKNVINKCNNGSKLAHLHSEFVFQPGLCCDKRHSHTFKEKIYDKSAAPSSLSLK